MTPQHLHDAFERCTRGDTTAFRDVMEEYQGYAYALAVRVLCDEEDARDIVQESFIRVWHNAASYNPAIKFTTWLYSIVTNLCLDKLRARSRKPVTSIEQTDLQQLPAADAGDDPERAFTSSETAAAIMALAECLPQQQKIIFILRDLQQLSVREVCDVLKVSEGSVKTNLVYARKYIRQHLERY